MITRWFLAGVFMAATAFGQSYIPATGDTVADKMRTVIAEREHYAARWRRYGGFRGEVPAMTELKEAMMFEGRQAAAVETHTPAEWKRIYERQKIAIESARKQSAEEAEQKKKAEESEMDLQVRIFTVKQNGGYPSARAKQVADRLAEDELDKAIAAARKARDQVNTTTNSVAIKKP